MYFSNNQINNKPKTKRSISMLKTTKMLLVLLFVILLQTNSYSQMRQDAIWAKMAPAGSIKLDGVLDEAVWSKAEEVKVVYGKPGPLPTSAWRSEFQEDVYFDQTNATVKFLSTTDNKLYLAFYVPDSSIGGTSDWARWDGILMSVKNKGSEDRPAPADEYFYTWWLEGLPEAMKTPVAGNGPRFIGKWGTWDDTTRTAEKKAAWNAVTKVIGTSNDDSTPDQAWVVEMMIDLGVEGYDITKPGGDAVAINFSIWDGDWIFKGDPLKIASARTWYQGPWGNANGVNVARILGDPGVTVDASVLPEIMPDGVIPNGKNYTDPIVDGKLDEEVWSGAMNFDIAWGSEEIRNDYPYTGPVSSGQFQPELGGNPRPPILDPSYGNIKMFFKDHYLYMAADVNDQLVQGTSEYDRIDGVRFIFQDRGTINSDNFGQFQQLRVDFDAAGIPIAEEYLKTLVDSGYAEWAVSLKGATTVGNNSDVDEGYQIEIKLDLQGMGYPADLGDKLLFGGVMLADGDSFDDPLADYGTRTWAFRENDWGPAAAWMVLDPSVLVVGVEEENTALIPDKLQIIGNYPNPFNPSTKIKYVVPEAGEVTLEFFNAIGERILSEKINTQKAGIFEYNFNASRLASGVYFYRIILNGVNKNNSDISNVGKMLLLK